jgi:hypothetical protein
MMKTFVLSFCLLVTTFSMTFAQSAQYQSAMSKQLALLDDPANRGPEKMQEIANTFERIAAAEKTQWLPYYYAAYCYVMNALSEKDKSKVDAIDDKAQAAIEKAESLSPKNDEIYCVKSLVATARIGVDPMTRGMQYGTEAATWLTQAGQINKENPRVDLLQGQSLYYTPEQFGGSKEKAKEKFELALKKFAAFKPASVIAPHWGEEYTKQLLAK